jgi:uncharacterized protein YbcV (DUF1398 family)
MLASNGVKETISFFLGWVKDASPTVRPGVIMTDRDLAQIAALEDTYPQSRIFLCKWHVLRAMRSHFVTNEFPALWDKVKALVNTEDQAEFHTIWEEISRDPSTPQSFVQYMKTWEQSVHMWSTAMRKNRTIFEEGNTNMLLEAYVN